MNDKEARLLIVNRFLELLILVIVLGIGRVDEHSRINSEKMAYFFIVDEHSRINSEKMAYF